MLASLDYPTRVIQPRTCQAMSLLLASQIQPAMDISTAQHAMLWMGFLGRDFIDVKKHVSALLDLAHRSQASIHHVANPGKSRVTLKNSKAKVIHMTKYSLSARSACASSTIP